jgi:hypothetical protein
MNRKKKKYVNTLSKKRMITNSIEINDKHYNVGVLIKEDPLLLWNAIHKKGSGLSLVRTAYHTLKSTILKIDPKLVEDIEKKKAEIENMAHHKKTKKELLEAIKNNEIGNTGCRFKPLNQSIIS